ncbi:MAG: hypothetical protein M1817_000818 [Caeruleum heppii]|nr:MAG: hypothetical protein M1817_000818 [Caeruleum heppii]
MPVFAPASGTLSEERGIAVHNDPLVKADVSTLKEPAKVNVIELDPASEGNSSGSSTPENKDSITASFVKKLEERIAALERSYRAPNIPSQPATPSISPELGDDGLRRYLSLNKKGSSIASTRDASPSPLKTVHHQARETAASDTPGDSAEDPSSKTANQILNIIERYGYSDKSAPDDSWVGKNAFRPTVLSHIKAGEAIRMVLPAFPFKSPNRNDKVLGSLPDLGEELALAHMNGLCESIAEVYEQGANVYVTSDGLVYNDLLEVSDEDVWTYGETLRQMCADLGFKYIKFVRLWDLLDNHVLPATELKAYYLMHASCFRRELVARYADPNFDPRAFVRSDQDACMTYRGYIKFLTKDLWHGKVNTELGKNNNGRLGGKKYKESIENIARSMISRGKVRRSVKAEDANLIIMQVFAAAIKAKFGDCVRLSIHPSVGEKKLPLSLIPQKTGGFGLTPWHSSISVGLDGSFSTVHAADVRETHDLVMRHGRPYYFRERSELYDWGDLKVEFEHLYPCGLIVRPAEGTTTPPSMRDIDMQKLRKLAELQSPVVARGFANTMEEETFQGKAKELGEILPWTFGIMQKVKDAGRNDKLHNNVVSNEAMPMHYDGMFKFETKKDENGNEIKVQNAPRFQFFTSIETAPKGSGYTLFAASRLFFQYLPRPWNVERFEKIRWGMDNNGFWDAKLKDLPLVVRHPVHNTPCMRWHEPWPASKTKFSTCDINIENDAQEVCEVVDALLYDRRVCLRFTWEKGDLLVSDNFAMLHTRTTFTGDCDRELWRIHFN